MGFLGKDWDKEPPVVISVTKMIALLCLLIQAERKWMMLGCFSDFNSSISFDTRCRSSGGNYIVEGEGTYGES